MTQTSERTVGWNFDNSYAKLPHVFFSTEVLNPVRTPELILLNHSLANSLGLDTEALQKGEGAEVFAGNKAPEGAMPLAQAYAGHQFGHFTMLGDGRAILLGEQITPSGERCDIVLKGSGRTRYSRGGDGRAALGPMLREHIISESMYALGIPTTRSLAVVTTGEMIVREIDLPGAILTRVAKSHLRVGTFQYAARWGSKEDLRALADYTLQRHFPGVVLDERRYLSLLKEVIKRQASLIAKWQLVGFIHGVMNTDNMTISGETIDYGPCAFMDTYHLETVFSSIDQQGRYAYGNQPRIAGWNLARLAEALLPLLHEKESEAVEIAQEAISHFPDIYRNDWLDGMRGKLGLCHAEKGDESLIESLLYMMQKYQADYTNTFRALTLDQWEELAFYGKPEWDQWTQKWQKRLEREQVSRSDSKQLMKSCNPAIIPRNHRVEEALESAMRGDLSVMNQLLGALSDPYAYTSRQATYCSLPDLNSHPYRTFCGT
ncbi:YdiU family protein [Thermoactinomyces sp. DSM 45892]|uniref:protein adenylyltransferase SelO n=1 Tax=Thermoactinomyces sp. DSM 45892 TaxID=1882753 RepID=UPI000899C5D6|nr:YdiU family protein [Thermoactinomyces sp. DSM 45892]SDZ03973.1 Uncharacterized conserved protein YdiU, UPF0061 family [Thermoactinomyces sp. DSM 45892]